MHLWIRFALRSPVLSWDPKRLGKTDQFVSKCVTNLLSWHRDYRIFGPCSILAFFFSFFFFFFLNQPPPWSVAFLWHKGRWKCRILSRVENQPVRDGPGNKNLACPDLFSEKYVHKIEQESFKWGKQSGTLYPVIYNILITCNEEF